jgi:hypothetical protein
LPVVALLGQAPLALAQDTLRAGDARAGRSAKAAGSIRIPDGPTMVSTSS